MTDLRQSCIEAMARRLHETRTPEFDVDEIPWEECHDLYRNDLRNVSMVALDALLSTLTEHADEWTRETQKQIDEYYNLITSGRFAVNLQAIADELLAVLRNPDQD